MATGASADFPAERTVSIHPHQLLFLTGDAESGLEMMNTSICECNAAVNNPNQCAAFYLSALGCIFPGIRVLAREMLTEKGFQLNELNESTMLDFAIEMRNRIDVATALAAFGQLVLILYRNIDSHNYLQYFQARANELKAEVGVTRQLNPDGGDVLLSVEAALQVKRVISTAPKLRAGVLVILIKTRTSDRMSGKVCTYCCDRINWTEMISLAIIFEELCVTNSPVLADSRVREEVIKLAETTRIMGEHGYPEFFRILHPTAAARYLDESRIPTLTEVAKLVRQRRITNVVNFATAQSTEATSLVRDLVRVHTRYIKSILITIKQDMPIQIG